MTHRTTTIFIVLTFALLAAVLFGVDKTQRIEILRRQVVTDKRGILRLGSSIAVAEALHPGITAELSQARGQYRVSDLLIRETSEGGVLVQAKAVRPIAPPAPLAPPTSRPQAAIRRAKEE